jgi:hypothetical protein
MISVIKESTREENCTFQWHRVVNGKDFIPIDNATTAEYNVTQADFGNRLRVEYTPVRIDNIEEQRKICTQ